MRPSTGTCSASLLPPMKLYLGKPLHLAAGGGNPGRNKGAKSNDPKVMDAGSVATTSLGEFADRRQHVDSRRKIAAAHVQSSMQHRRSRALRASAFGFCDSRQNYIFINILVSFTVLLWRSQSGRQLVLAACPHGDVCHEQVRGFSRL